MATAIELGVADPATFIKQVLRLDGPVSKRGEMRVLCPQHKDVHPSCDVNVHSGLWRCWSCGAKGDLVSLARSMLGLKTRSTALKLLRPDDPSSMRIAVQNRVSAALRASEPLQGPNPSRSVVVPSWGSWEPPRADLLVDRGFTEDTLERWGVRWVHHERLVKPGKEVTHFTITNSHAIPITYEDGLVRSWCFRATSESEKWQPKYLYLPGVDTEPLLFGRLHNHGATVLGVTEGALDAMWLDQCGLPAVAILGASSAGPANISYIARHRSVVLVCDRDQAGTSMAERLGQALVQQGVGVSVCLWRSWMQDRSGQPAKDANDLPPLDVELLWETALPWATWMLRRQRRVQEH